MQEGQAVIDQKAESPAESLELTLQVTEESIVRYLNQFDQPEREEKALEALRVGVIAIQSASPSLDTRIVEEKFREVQDRIHERISGFGDELRQSLDSHFSDERGSVPRSMEKIFGEEGKMASLMKDYFAGDNGRLAALLQSQIGPGSGFAKALDPANRESVIFRLQEAVKTQVEQQVSAVVKEFSLDTEESGFSRMQKQINDRISEIRDQNAAFFAELKEALGVETGREEEAEKGTGKGREFEMALYDPVAEWGRGLNDETENTRSSVGAIPRSKVGDYVITLGDTSATPGKKIVIEAKKDKSYTFKKMAEEMDIAKQNREADIGIFAVAKGYETAEMGDFLKVGNDFYVTVDEKDLEDGKSLVYLEAAYKISRAMIVTMARAGEREGVNLELLKQEIEYLLRELDKLRSMKSKAETVRKNAVFIIDTVDELNAEFSAKLNSMQNLLGTGE